MRSAAALILALLWALPGWCAPADEARALFGQGRYAQGKEVLDRALAGPALSPESRAEALLALAEFEADLAGNPLEAERICRRIEAMDRGGPFSGRFRSFLGRFRAFSDRFRTDRGRFAEGDFLLALAGAPPGPEARESSLRLREYLEKTTDYWRAAEAWHILALSARDQGRYTLAIQDLARAAALAPAVDFFLPVATLAAQVREARTRQWAARAALGTLALCAALALAVFFWSRPGKWLSLRHLAWGGALAVAWLAAYAACFAAFSRWGDPRGILAADPNVKQAFVLHASLASPGAGPALALAGWGLLGTALLYLFALGASRFRSRLSALLACWIFAWLLFGSLAGGFWVRHLWGAAYEAPAGSVLRYARGFFFFDVPGAEDPPGESQAGP